MDRFDLFKLKLPKTDMWQYLRESKLPVILYGMGDGADKIIKVLDSLDIKITDIFASDEFVRGHSFHGFKVKKYSEVCDCYEKANVLLCFAARTRELYERFSAISERFNFFAPDVPVVGKGLFTLDYFKQNENKIKNVYNMLADERSIITFENIILYKLSGKIKFLKLADFPKEEAFAELLKLSNNESFLDLGAYRGDTVEEFVDVTGKNYKSILAVEPDLRSFKKLDDYLVNVPNSKAINCGVSNTDGEVLFSNKAGRMSSIGKEKGILTKIHKVDTLCDKYNFTASYIKMDLEGEERNALSGAASVLQKRPKLLISAYHRTEDIFDIPLYIKALNPDYKIFLRKHTYIPAWDINVYAI